MDDHNMSVELTDREVCAIERENTGTVYKRRAVISDRAFEAQIESALAPVKSCPFKNKWGWCLMPEGHADSHTVVWLGDE